MLTAAPQRSTAVQMIGVASGCGAPDTRCAAGPDALLGLSAQLRKRGVDAGWVDIIRPPAADRTNTLEIVRSVCAKVARRVSDVVHEHAMPVVIGGDHTCAIGTWKGIAHGVRERGAPGLLWIDAHMDAHTPETTESGMLHGMPLACLLGYGYQTLTQIADGAHLEPRHVCLFGVRSFEHGEAALLKRLGVKVFYTHEIETLGVARALREAIEVVAAAPAGFGITLDLDAVDPADAPGVGTPAANGIRASDLIAALAEHRTARDLLAIEIVEFNPLRDREGATAGIVSDALDALLGQSVLPVPFATRSKRTVQRAVV